MNKELLLLLCGIYNILFAIFHILFWKIFKWNIELKKYSISTRAIIQILNIRLIYVFSLMSFIYLFFTELLLNTKLGYALLLGFLGFWIGRTIEQFIFFKTQSKFVRILTIVLFFGIILHLLPIII